LHGIANARVIERRSYPTAANWKLVLENFFECYHCRPAHPEYFRLNGHVSVTAIRDEAAASRWNSTLEEWLAARDPATRLEPVRDAGAIDRLKVSVYRQPIGLGRQTHSRDGAPIAPLMGSFTEYDGGETAMHLGRFSFMGAYNDHAVLCQFIPRGPQDTDVVATWFGAAEADPATIDIDALTYLWDVTTRQDKQIIEENAAGVRSPAYVPGPYTRLETQTAAFIADYVGIMAKLAGA
jgi:Rieske 2Fe-2S family protein